MTADLPVGSIFALRERGSHLVWSLTDWPGNDPTRTHGMTGVGRPLQVGETVYRCVLKGGKLEVRGKHVIAAGDVEWVDSGLVSTIAKDPDTGRPTKIFKNRFTDNAPAWLRNSW